MPVNQSGNNAAFTANGDYNDVHVAGDWIVNNNQATAPEVNLGPTEQVLRRLRPANMDASHRTGCLPGTRTKWTQSVMQWALDASDKRNVLWIYGLAGSGKSTLATEVANQLLEKGHLGAFAFFERDVIDRSEPSLVIRTVAYGLGLNQRQLRDAICAAVEHQPNVAHFPLESQFRQLLVKPMPVPSSTPPPRVQQPPPESQILPPQVQKSSVRGKLRKLLSHKTTEKPSTTVHEANPMPLATVQYHAVVIVLDAFDECGTPDKRASLLRILSELTKDVPYIRFIITSRPERDIRGAFEPQSHVLSRELDTSSHDATHDISTYLTIRLNQIKFKSFDLGAQTDWPGDEAFQRLVRRASGLFIWATTAAQFIDVYDPDAKLQLLVQDGSSGGVDNKLDVLYRTTLGSAGEWDNENFVQDFRSMMGVVLASARPLSAEAIDQLRNSNDERRACARVVSHLGCLMQQRPFVRLLHPSFADFLFTRSRCERESWLFDQKSLYHDLAVCCINLLNKNLAYNIRNLTLSPEPVNERLSEPIEYACLYWIEHICRVQDTDFDNIIQLLNDFLSQHLLHWLEAMSILKMTRDSIGLLEKLSASLSKTAIVGKEIMQLVNDGIRFVRRHADVIETHPLLVYSSALPFTPPESLTFKIFHDSNLHPVPWGAVESSWSPLLQVLLGHGNSVNSVRFSPDGSRIVSGSADRTIRVWDASSGIEVLPPLRGHGDYVNSVTFSPNGARIASGSADGTVRLWDASSGSELLPPMQRHIDTVNSVKFFPDGKTVISGSNDNTIRFWDASSGAEVRPPLKGYAYGVKSMSVSPDGTRIVSGSHERTVRVWDITSDVETLARLQGHHSVISVSFSPDGNHIASGSFNGNVCLWDSNTGVRIRVPFKGHLDRVWSVAFSPDGTRIVSSSDDQTIKVWDVTTGIQVIPTFVYNTHLYSASFSPDGTRIVSGSMDGAIQVWDATLTSSVGPFSKPEGHTSNITSLAFSSDGNRLASGSSDNTVCVWDSTSGAQLLPPLAGHSDEIWSVAFSPDGTRIVSASPDKTVHVWNAMTGREVLPPLQHEAWLRSAAFSSDGSRIVLLDLFNQQYVWDANSGHRVSDEGHVALMELASDIVVEDSGWIIDRSTKKYLSKLPSTFHFSTHSSYKRSLALGTSDGQIFVIHFPANS